MKNWLDWFLYGGYRDLGGVDKSWSARIMIGVLNVIYAVYAWGWQIGFFLLLILNFVYLLVTHLPRKKFGWPPFWELKW